MNFTNAVLGAVLGLVSSISLTFTVQELNPTSKGLRVGDFSYDGVAFEQVIEPVGSKSLPGHWTAEINRLNPDGTTDQLCAGNGDGIYSGSAQRFNPDEWTGDNCPQLDPSDTAEATWEFRDGNGSWQATGVDGTLEELGWDTSE